MTREEAIYTLGNFKRYISGGGVTDLKANEAIDMAIEALKAESSTEGRYEKAIKTLQEIPKYLNGVKAKQIKKISVDRPSGEWVNE